MLRRNRNIFTYSFNLVYYILSKLINERYLWHFYESTFEPIINKTNQLLFLLMNSFYFPLSQEAFNFELIDFFELISVLAKS